MALSTCSQRAGATSAGVSNHVRGARVVVRASSELKRPELRRPEMSPTPAPVAKEAPKRLFSDAPVEPTVASSSSNVVTIEYQRQRAKEMNKYFNNVKLQQQISQSTTFGWTPANEISNGRWVMFGFSVGLLTEYATGVNFIQQFALMISYLGIADIE